MLKAQESRSHVILFSGFIQQEPGDPVESGRRGVDVGLLEQLFPLVQAHFNALDHLSLLLHAPALTDLHVIRDLGIEESRSFPSDSDGGVACLDLLQFPTGINFIEFSNYMLRMKK